jgi:monovalent cation:H+ antiporter-2, CPA2 family
MEVFVFKDLIIIFGLSILVLLIGHRLNIPPVVGFLITGVIAGPHGLALIENMHDVEILAEIGILLLLFGIGMEFSIKKLIEVKHYLLIGGTLQVALTILSGFVIANFFHTSWQSALFFAFLLSMSSTAIVLRLLEQRGDVSSPQGRTSIAILIFQDMIAIPLLLIIPLLSQGVEDGPQTPSIGLLLTGVVTLVVVFFCAEKLVPRLMLLIARTRCRELFLLSLLGLCFSVAWLTSSLGLSLTIGAFLAGLIISESEYSSEAIGDIFPFQALFVSFFFVSIGMLLDLNFVIHHPLTIILIASIIIVLKILCAGLATLALGLPIRTAILVGIALCQIGEFSFVLAKTGIIYHLATDYEYQLFLAASLLTIALSPLLMNYADSIADLVSLLPLPNRLKIGYKAKNQHQNQLNLQNHIIIVGFGVSGRNLARSSKAAKIPYIILEMNPDTVHEQKALGEPIFFGDASHPSILEHAQIHKAKAVAILINDPIAAKMMVKNTRAINSSVYIIVRTRYIQETKLMTYLGADETIPDELGASIEIFSRVLKQYHIPKGEIETLINEIYEEGYEMFRTQQHRSNRLLNKNLELSNMNINSFRIHPQSELIGKSLIDTRFRQTYGITVLLIRRGLEIIHNPASELQLIADDVLVVAGDDEPLKRVEKVFNPI